MSNHMKPDYKNILTTLVNINIVRESVPPVITTFTLSATIFNVL